MSLERDVNGDAVVVIDNTMPAAAQTFHDAVLHFDAQGAPVFATKMFMFSGAGCGACFSPAGSACDPECPGRRPVTPPSFLVYGAVSQPMRPRFYGVHRDYPLLGGAIIGQGQAWADKWRLVYTTPTIVWMTDMKTAERISEAQARVPRGHMPLCWTAGPDGFVRLTLGDFGVMHKCSAPPNVCEGMPDIIARLHTPAAPGKFFCTAKCAAWAERPAPGVQRSE